MKISDINGKLVITDFDEYTAYLLAVRMEKDGIGFYVFLSGRAKEKPAAKEVFEFLIKEEESHLKYFEDQIKKTSRPGGAGRDEDLLTMLDLGVFQAHPNLRKLSKETINAEKALTLALEIETRSIDFYRSCLEHVSSQPVKDELEKIIREEAGHRELLGKALLMEREKK